MKVHNLYALLLLLLLISEVRLNFASDRRGTRLESERFHGDFPATRDRKMMVKTETDYLGDYYDDGSSSSSSSPPAPDYDDFYRRQGDVPSPGIGH
ncbi:PREDICTED: uncharacterized protein LOC104803197 [Tarenaya hassleriana]|uniref:uncharacterized protein LOC104803197 n=1 Tax=Tarenaya hassleriana TaxID=28532 RepID=UPI00053C14EB|nr:PREDICTED: uncharacterized protein LOC104803197 [Tarenaya hassleriana]